jgi:hypothetical protein
VENSDLEIDVTRPVFDPETFLLEADLSRADVRLLYRFCKDKRVVEFGCGGSTVMLAAFVEHLVSYDTDASWVERTTRRLSREQEHTCAAVVHCGDKPPVDLPNADVYFVDGFVPHRILWVEEVIRRRLSETIIVHDSRSSAMNDLSKLMVYPLTFSFRSFEFHVDGSNMLVIRAGAPVEYVNWNEAEPKNRLGFLS